MKTLQVEDNWGKRGFSVTQHGDYYRSKNGELYRIVDGYWITNVENSDDRHDFKIVATIDVTDNVEPVTIKVIGADGTFYGPFGDIGPTETGCARWFLEAARIGKIEPCTSQSCGRYCRYCFGTGWVWR